MLQPKSSKKKFKIAAIFGFLKVKLNKNSKRKKYDKSNEYFEEDQQQPSSVTPVSTITIPQQFSDEDLIESELIVDTSSKSSTSLTSEISLEKPKEKSYMKLFRFSRKHTVNSSSCSVNSSNSEQNDSAYETETEIYSKEKEKKMRKTRMTILSENDKEYIEIQNLFRVGSPSNKIHGIIRLQMPTKLVEAHEQYKKKTARQSYRMFHGTRTGKFCNPHRFVNKKSPTSTFCKFGCGLCGIAQEGNRRKYSNHQGRMWFADSSATSLSYCSDSNAKGMFVVDVVADYSNSILITDKDEATIPKYLIIYK